MPTLPAYYFSLLTRQLALGAEAFLRRYPNSWLVWEAGGTPGHLSDVALSVVETSLVEKREARRPGTGDALCFVLNAPDGEPLRVGRAIDNELVIADPTVSRLHAQLLPVGHAWHLLPVSTRRQTLVAGKVADPGESIELLSGKVIELGSVKLSYFDAKAFQSLVAKAPLRASR